MNLFKKNSKILLKKRIKWFIILFFIVMKEEDIFISKNQKNNFEKELKQKFSIIKEYLYIWFFPNKITFNKVLANRSLTKTEFQEFYLEKNHEEIRVSKY